MEAQQFELVHFDQLSKISNSCSRNYNTIECVCIDLLRCKVKKADCRWIVMLYYFQTIQFIKNKKKVRESTWAAQTHSIWGRSTK